MAHDPDYDDVPEDLDKLFMDAFQFEGPDHKRIKKALNEGRARWTLLGDKLLDLYLADLVTSTPHIDAVDTYYLVRDAFTQPETREKCLTERAFGTFVTALGQAWPNDLDQRWNIFLNILALMYRDTDEELCHAFLHETVYPYVCDYLDDGKCPSLE